MIPNVSEVPARPALSVVVPVGPNHCFPPDLAAALAESSTRIEIIAGTFAGQSLKLPETVHRATADRPGRGRQLNSGAAHARADWLWFVHADCRFQPPTVAAVERFIQRDRPAIGYCQLRFLEDGHWLMRLNAIGANLRSGILGLPYGDQGLCLPADWFRRLDGFREDLPRGEDLDFVVRARLAGLHTGRIGAPIRTSARRYKQEGWLRTTLDNQRAAWRLIRNARRSVRVERS